jgi:hypothetical protein
LICGFQRKKKEEEEEEEEEKKAIQSAMFHVDFRCSILQSPFLAGLMILDDSTGLIQQTCLFMAEPGIVVDMYSTWMRKPQVGHTLIRAEKQSSIQQIKPIRRINLAVKYLMPPYIVALKLHHSTHINQKRVYRFFNMENNVKHGVSVTANF